MISLIKPQTMIEVEEILKNPDVFDRISEDGADRETYKAPDNRENYYLLMNNGSKNIGLWILHPENKTTLQIHCNILPQYRAEYKYEAGRAILEWFLVYGPDNYQKLNCEIPVIYSDVYHYTVKFGFKDEGINRKSILKNGALVNQYRLGITRQEIKEFLEV